MFFVGLDYISPIRMMVNDQIKSANFIPWGRLNKWKFQNPEIKANAFYLYVFLMLSNHRQLVLLLQI